jgi:hypothetical protein
LIQICDSQKHISERVVSVQHQKTKNESTINVETITRRAGLGALGAAAAMMQRARRHRRARAHVRLSIA